MKTNSTLRATSTAARTALGRFPILSVGLGVAMVTAFAVIVPWGVSGQVDAARRACGPHTLNGDYGLTGTGIRGLGPGASEPFATISMVSYDGQGGFTAVGTSHGLTTGVRSGQPVSGTYYVNEDCTGGQTTNIPGVPPLEDHFVIADNGREVRTVVVSPATTIATANLRRK